ncbi:MAG: divalent-cation tolerance protein CutA [Candidatus Omnitrophica bacterium]|nr:divalent-cation tolerance protein CutA [Candidatus Omnitrophota bacterium]
MARRAPGAVLLVLVTCPTPAVARRLARALLRQRLAACVNILPGVRSLFWWRGKVDQGKEVLLLIKTVRAHFPALRRRILSLHPYEVPEVIAFKIQAGHLPYLAWVASETAKRGRRA